MLDPAIAGGEYRFTLLAPLDHLVSGTEDSFVLPISFVANGNGSATGIFNIHVNDNSPATPARLPAA